MIYKDYRRNHVIFPGRESALLSFLGTELAGVGHHKWKHRCNSSSEDALTWSCFDVLRCLPVDRMVIALDEMLEDSFDGVVNFSFAAESDIVIEIGKRYATLSLPEVESTELDASIETSSKLIFIEAKLYSTIGLPDAVHTFDQIIRKLRVGLDIANVRGLDFYFIFLDIAPIARLSSLYDGDRTNLSELLGVKRDNSDFSQKSLSACLFSLYRSDFGLLSTQLSPISCPVDLPSRMGWYTWSSLFKTVLRAVVS